MRVNAKRRVVELLKSLETREPRALRYISAEKYIQHSLLIEDGVYGFLALLGRLPKGSAAVNTVRVLQDGRFVFTHSEYNLFGWKVGFDIFRFDKGRIVEHWDNLQARPDAPNPSGRTMIDGTTAVGDLGRTVRNKALAQAFVHQVLVSGRHEQMAQYLDTERFVQHSPQIADGLYGMAAAFRQMSAQGITMCYERIHMVLGEGDFVLVVSEGRFAGRHTSFYDLFRFEAGRITEHWDTIEAIPPRHQWKHSNGKF